MNMRFRTFAAVVTLAVVMVSCRSVPLPPTSGDKDLRQSDPSAGIVFNHDASGARLPITIGDLRHDKNVSYSDRSEGARFVATVGTSRVWADVYVYARSDGNTISGLVDIGTALEVVAVVDSIHEVADTIGRYGDVAVLDTETIEIPYADDRALLALSAVLSYELIEEDGEQTRVRSHVVITTLNGYFLKVRVTESDPTDLTLAVVHRFITDVAEYFDRGAVLSDDGEDFGSNALALLVNRDWSTDRAYRETEHDVVRAVDWMETAESFGYGVERWRLGQVVFHWAMNVPYLQIALEPQAIAMLPAPESWPGSEAIILALVSGATRHAILAQESVVDNESGSAAGLKSAVRVYQLLRRLELVEPSQQMEELSKQYR